ncbi:hypothetical protein NQ318_000036 [Aromia moschata]|uniref:C2H2-type domain-containing protein n=1 Tax=Aromia moschata TaxID=1265417 RepID=A0AAV8YAA0_9CUCU|nr:hypothetical protein NQ318_000036 [Aromia moschata]
MWIHEDILKDASEMETNLQVKSEVEDLEEAVYRCNLCPYETRLEKYLTQHMLGHKDNPELTAANNEDVNAPEIEPSLPIKPVEDVEKTIYRCHLCRYKAKRKATLTRHMLVHRDISEVAGYQCKLCPRKTERKIDLVNHVKWIHEGSSKVTMYVCNVCSHETKRKRDMKSHMLIHKDDSKVVYEP